MIAIFEGPFCDMGAFFVGLYIGFLFEYQNLLTRLRILCEGVSQRT
jgi:hypothetical protein